MTYEIQLGGRTISYCWTKKPVKNLNLRIRRDGTVAVSSHPRISYGEIQAFLRQNEAFILRSLRRWESQQETVGVEFSLEHGGTFPLLGKHLRVELERRKEPPFGVLVTGDTLCLRAPSDDPETLRQIVRRWMGRRMEELMPRLCEEAALSLGTYGVTPPELQYRCMVSRWGSCCATTRTVTFNKFLLCAPMPCIEYVVYHELIHLIVPNHSPAFYRVLDEAMPDWKSRRETLSPYGSWIRQL
ncbi:MAG: M48 family metallopeptidase [Clostridia bacterium]|nr:M48 family metallopeptidase [Clostridia bacterium]